MKSKVLILLFLALGFFTPDNLFSASNALTVREKEIKAQVFNVLLGHGVGGFIQGNATQGVIFLISDLLISTGVGFSLVQIALDASQPYLIGLEKPLLVTMAISSSILFLISRVTQIALSGRYSEKQRQDLVPVEWGLQIDSGRYSLSMRLNLRI